MAQPQYSAEQLKQIAAAEHERVRAALLQHYGLPPSALPDVYYETPEQMKVAAERASRIQQHTVQKATLARRARTRPPRRTVTPTRVAPTPAVTPAPAPTSTVTQEQRERITKLEDQVSSATKLVGQLESASGAEADQRATVVKLLREEAAKARAAGRYEEAAQLTLQAAHRDPSRVKSYTP